MDASQIDVKKRRTLVAATSVAFGVGAVSVAVPFLSSMSPSERAKAAGAPVTVDLSKIAIGQRVSVIYRGKPVWIVRRNKAILDNISQLNSKVADPDSNQSKQPNYCHNSTRAVAGHEDIFVAISLCTHLGCIPSYIPEVEPQLFDKNWKGGFYCPCHGSLYDLAGRVYPGVPAPTNLEIPEYTFTNKNTLVIGLSPNDTKKGVV